MLLYQLREQKQIQQHDDCQHNEIIDKQWFFGLSTFCITSHLSLFILIPAITCEPHTHDHPPTALRFLQMQFNLFYLTAFSAKIKEKKEENSKINVNLLPAPILLFIISKIRLLP